MHAFGVVHIIQSRIRILLPCIECQNAQKLACRRFFACAAPILQIFGIENAAIFAAKLADRARATFCMNFADGNGARHRVVMRCLQDCAEIFCNRNFAFVASIFQIFGAENAAIFREKICKSRAQSVAHVIQARLRILLLFAAFHNACRTVCT